MTNQTSKTNSNAPSYYVEMGEKYGAGITNAFILFGNVGDYAIPSVSLTNFLTRSFSNRDVVIYNIGTGFSFPTKASRERFIKLLDMESAQGRVMMQKLGLHRSGPTQHDVNSALLAITEFLQKTGGKNSKGENERQSAVIIENAEMLFPADGMRQKDDRIDVNIALQWGRNRDILANGNITILQADSLSSLAAPLRTASSRFEAIEIGIPDYETRLDYINWYYAQEQAESDADPNYQTFESKISPEYFATVASALQLVNIEDIFLRAIRAGKLTAEMIIERKREIIRSEYDDVIDWIKTETTFEDVGDLDHVKAGFKRLVIDPMKTGGDALQMVPMGILMTGPAGTGKTIIAEALATEAGVNFVNLNLSRIFSMWVGESEKNIEKLKRALYALAPVIVFIDEIDKAIQQDESGDSGVSQRVYKSIQELMSETSHRGQIMFLAATNRPDRIAAALMRPGRMDKVIPFFVPNRNGRESIIKVMARKYGKVENLDVSESALDKSEKWTGAELEGAAVKALEIAQVDNLDFGAAFEKALTRILPNTRDIEFMTQLGVFYCNDLDLVPEDYHEMARNRGKLQADIESETKNEDYKRGGREW